jgi:hypothetical protein
VLITVKLQCHIQDFFDRGSRDECQKYLPQKYKLARSRRSKVTGRKTAELSHYFASESASQADKGVKAIQSINESEILDNTEFANFWTSRTHLLRSSETNLYLRLRHLVNELDNFEKALSACTIRLSLLFFSHDVDAVQGMVSKEELGHGRGATSIALDKIEAKSGLKRTKVQEMLKRSKIYLSIATQCGVGSLLALGSGLFV